MQKLSLQWHVDVDWPSWFLNFLDVLAFLCFKMPAFGIEVAWLEKIPEDCVFVARLLLPVALLARMWWMMMSTDNKEEWRTLIICGCSRWGAPHYGSSAWVVCTVALVVAAPTSLSVLAIWIGASMARTD